MTTTAPRGDAQHTDEDDTILVAAPPWAAEPLAAIAGSGMVPKSVRHVPVDPRDPAAAPVPGVSVLWRLHLRAPRLARAVELLPDCRWVHSDYVGVDDLPLQMLADRGITLTNGAGISTGPIAEWIVLALLAAAKQLPRFVRQSDRGQWEVGPTLAELAGSVVVLLGLGAIGTRAASLLAPFGVTIRGCSRQPRSGPVPGVDELFAGPQWRRAVTGADYLVSTLPLTADTAGLLDADIFAAMKPGGWVVNVSRGGVVDEAALLQALDSGHLGGAVLDAFREEPLPAASPLWARPDVLVLPHVTWSSAHALDDFTWRFADQLRRFADGLPPADVVDLTAGY